MIFVEDILRGEIRNEVYGEVRDRYEPSTIVGIGRLVTFYKSLNHFISTFEIETEEEFFGWHLENLPPQEN